MNALEKAICRGVQDTHAFYVDIADDWLFDAPESFLQHLVAWSIIRRTNHCALTELSPKKIAAEFLKKPKGRKPNNSRRRFDVAVWRKTGTRLRGVIEIKRAVRFNAIDEDARKIEKYLGLRTATGCGYLLVYSEVDSAKKRIKGKIRRAKLIERMNDWAGRLKRRRWVCTGMGAISPQDSLYNHKHWSWGYALYKLEKK